MYTSVTLTTFYIYSDLPPTKNFNIAGAPTPGFGIQWERSVDEEHDNTRDNPDLKRIERYDRYLHSQ